MYRTRAIFQIVFLAAALVLAGCSANRLVSQWNNQTYATAAFHKILIGGGSGESAIRRNLEDEFVAQLRAGGVEAVPSYQFIPEDRDVEENALKKAAQAAGADAIIFGRSTGVEQKTEYYSGYYPSFGVFGPHFGASWYGFYGAPTFRTYNVYASEVTLYDLGKNDVVWTGTVRTDNTYNVDSTIKNYVEVVLKALEEKQLLRIRR
jgi:hypothetical protein